MQQRQKIDKEIEALVNCMDESFTLTKKSNNK